MLYSAPALTLMGAAAVIPVMVMGLDVCRTPILEPVTGGNPACLRSCAALVTVYVEVRPPMLTIADDVVLYVEAAVVCTTCLIARLRGSRSRT